MLNRLMLLALALCVPIAWGSDYYATTAGKTGQELRQALHAIIRNHVVIPYSSTAFDTSDALKVLDEDPGDTNNVLLLYAQRSEPKATFGLTTGWNREHQWPNSYGLDDQHPAYSDLFNLRAEDENVNSARGNKFYDVRDTNAVNYRFPAHAEARCARLIRIHGSHHRTSKATSPAPCSTWTFGMREPQASRI